MMEEEEEACGAQERGADVTKVSTCPQICQKGLFWRSLVAFFVRFTSIYIYSHKCVSSIFEKAYDHACVY